MQRFCRCHGVSGSCAAKVQYEKKITNVILRNVSNGKNKTKFVVWPEFHEQGMLEEVEIFQRVWFLADGEISPSHQVREVIIGGFEGL